KLSGKTLRQSWLVLKLLIFHTSPRINPAHARTLDAAKKVRVTS
ncbi:unnamed protein product, partial [Brassica rapa subsp. trilocularis]